MKKTVILIFSLLIIVTITACGQEKTQDAPSVSQPESASVFCTFQGKTDGYKIDNSGDLTKIWSALAIDTWQPLETDMQDSTETIVIDYQKPNQTKITLNSYDEIALITQGEESPQYYAAAEGTYRELNEVLDSILAGDTQEIVLNNDNIQEILNEIISDPTLKASDGDVMDIYCASQEIINQLQEILITPQWQLISAGEMPAEGGLIAMFYTDNNSSLLIENSDGKTYMTLSYHGEIYEYYETDGDCLTPLLSLLASIK